ncbi:hypothetical protein QFC24_000748 [Naganishia onofrii]|uniref:Uncharacterized protein n=1 Tax=Naganishia onofrii TaxID=1851511 RepID=A0ACC2XUM1_9TREE|nr:hypothetical protein QFC24_000748 [Naganishia onofrii]
MPRVRKSANPSMPPSAAMRQAALLKEKPGKKATEKVVVIEEEADDDDVKPTIATGLPPPPPPLVATEPDVKPSNMEIDELAEDKEQDGDDTGRAKWATVDEDEKPDVEETRPPIVDASNVPCPHPELLPLIKQFEQAFAAGQRISADLTMKAEDRRIQNAVIATQQKAISKAMKVALDRLGIKLPSIGLPLP